VGLVDEPRTSPVVIPGLQDAGGAAVDLQGHGLGLGHQGELGRRLDHPAAVDDRAASTMAMSRRVRRPSNMPNAMAGSTARRFTPQDVRTGR
jgi:hypothetical protein